MDQLLERLAGPAYYYILDGYSSYNQIFMDPLNQEKISFNYLFGVFVYKRMSFGLCIAPATFQKCLLAIFSKYLFSPKIIINKFTKETKILF